MTGVQEASRLLLDRQLSHGRLELWQHQGLRAGVASHGE